LAEGEIGGTDFTLASDSFTSSAAALLPPPDRRSCTVASFGAVFRYPHEPSRPGRAMRSFPLSVSPGAGQRFHFTPLRCELPLLAAASFAVPTALALPIRSWALAILPQRHARRRAAAASRRRPRPLHRDHFAGPSASSWG